MVGFHCIIYVSLSASSVLNTSCSDYLLDYLSGTQISASACFIVRATKSFIVKSYFKSSVLAARGRWHIQKVELILGTIVKLLFCSWHKENAQWAT